MVNVRHLGSTRFCLQHKKNKNKKINKIKKRTKAAAFWAVGLQLDSHGNKLFIKIIHHMKLTITSLNRDIVYNLER
jgi:hypothetical protein